VFDPIDSPWRPRATAATAEVAVQEEVQAVPAGAYDFKEHIKEYEIARLQAAMEECRFNQKKTAEQLGMTYHQLRGYLRKYGLTEGEEE
jgi:psp operon transcriptional activator